MWWHFQSSTTAFHHFVSTNVPVLRDFIRGSVEIESVQMDGNATVSENTRKVRKKPGRDAVKPFLTLRVDIRHDPPTKKCSVSSREKPNCCSSSNLQILLRKYEYESIITYGATPIKYNKLLLLLLYTKSIFRMLTSHLEIRIVFVKKTNQGPSDSFLYR